MLVRKSLISRAGPIFKEIRQRAVKDFADGIITKTDFDTIMVYADKLQETIWRAERTSLGLQETKGAHNVEQ